MAKSIISYDSFILRIKHRPNITSSIIDDITDNGIYHVFFESGTPFIRKWGILIVITNSEGNPCEQIQIVETGIAVRHKENGIWSSWKKVTLT